MSANASALIAAARAAREASRTLATLPAGVKNAALLALADGLEREQDRILAASGQDVAEASAAGLAPAKLQRLGLSESAVLQLAAGVRQVAALADPVGAVVKAYDTPAGLRVERVRTPLGVIAMIYEARPGVTIDAFALCFKAGNACVLKGGKEAARANAVLADIAAAVLARHKLPRAALTVVSALSRDELIALLALEQDIDLVIPRGGSELVRFVKDHSRIPVIQHERGVCHVFVDASADVDDAVRICANAKASAPATCNSAECLLVDRAIAPRFIPAMLARFGALGVEVRGDEETLRFAETASASGPGVAPACRVIPAAPEDFGREFLDLVIAMRVVAGLDEAIAHIHRHGTLHTEAILTQTPAHADTFTRRVQASCVLVNASTRFNDGFQLGLGAEIGISTTKLHAFGPMGLEELTTTRFVVHGEGQTRA